MSAGEKTGTATTAAERETGEEKKNHPSPTKINAVVQSFSLEQVQIWLPHQGYKPWTQDCSVLADQRLGQLFGAGLQNDQGHHKGDGLARMSIVRERMLKAAP